MRAEAGECARARGGAPDDGGGFPAQRARGCCAIVRIGMPLGARVLGAVRATRAAVGQNTNLGILLLAAPLIMAAEAGDCSGAGMGAVLDAATTRDTADVFAAITLASPAGLGEAPDHDVRGPATAPLWLVMQRAAERDRIAAQYASGFDAVFQLGLPAYRSARARWAIRTGRPALRTSAFSQQGRTATSCASSDRTRQTGCRGRPLQPRARSWRLAIRPGRPRPCLPGTPI